MKSRDPESTFPGGQPDKNRLRRLLNGDKTTAPSWLNKPDSQLPSLEQTTPRSFTLNSSVDTTYDEDFPELSSQDNSFNEPPGFDPFRAMVNLFSPLPKNAASRKSSPFPREPVELGVANTEDSEDLNENVADTEEEHSSSSLDDSFDPFQEIRDMASPDVNDKTESRPGRQEKDDDAQHKPDPLRQLVDFFSPHKAKSPQVAKKANDRMPQVFFPLKHQVAPERTELTPGVSAKALAKQVPATANADMPVAKQVPSTATAYVPVAKQVPFTATANVPVAKQVPATATATVPVAKQVLATATANVPVAKQVPATATADVPVAKQVSVTATVDVRATKEVPPATNQAVTASADVPLTQQAVTLDELFRIGLARLVASVKDSSAFQRLNHISDVDWLRQIREAEWLNQIRDAEWLNQIRDAEWLNQIRDAEWLHHIRDAEWLNQIPAAEWLHQIRNAEWLNQICDAVWLNQIRVAEWLNQIRDAEWLNPIRDAEWLNQIRAAEWLNHIRDAEWLNQICDAEWLKQIRDVDLRTVTESSARNAKQAIKMVVDSSKRIDPTEVIHNAKASARQVTHTVRRNACANPHSWAAIASVSCVILVHVLFFNQSAGTPVYRHGEFTIKLRESIPVHFSSQIVDRVGSGFQSRVGDDSKLLGPQVGLNGTCPHVRLNMTRPMESGGEILLRISKAMENLEPKPDIYDAIEQRWGDFRRNPRLLLSTLDDSWKASRQFLANEAFSVTLL